MARAGEDAVDREALESVLSRTERGIQVRGLGNKFGQICNDFDAVCCIVAGCFAAGPLLEPGSRDHPAPSLPAAE